MNDRSREPWTAKASAELYRLEEWGGGYFGVSPRGTVEVYPHGDPSRKIDLLEVVEGLKLRELGPPVMIRFPDIIAHRMRDLRDSFDRAIRQTGYEGRYSCVYPVKVNQQRHICEEIRNRGAELGFGLEAGSKPELLAVLALTEGNAAMPVVCNGFKDDEFIETVILAAKMGRNIIPVAEQFHELELIVEHAQRYGVHPTVGIRVRLSSEGIGRWAGSAGFRGKFGLSASQVLEAVDYLRERDILDSLRMLHCHIGSQVYDIRTVKYAVSELAHVYTELFRLGAPIGILDVGGGLGIDYDGSQSASESSVNYTLDEYATDVVYRIQTVCDEAGVAHPDVFTESGRALVAHAGVLVCEAMGSRALPDRPSERLIERALQADEVPQPLLDIVDAYERRDSGDPTELYHDAAHARDEALSLFNLGYMDLHSRAAVEELFWTIGNLLLERLGPDLPEEFQSLPELLGDLYFCNFSVFQSLLDAWGIEQVFPIVPIHRLDEKPTRRGVLVDITCDSDGRIDHFSDPGGVKRTLELHPLVQEEDGLGKAGHEPYYVGIFLVAAYQETLGDLHNLLGDTHAVHVSLAEDGRWRIDEVIEGDTVREVLRYVQYNPDEMRRAMRRDIEASVESGRLTVPEAASLRRFLDQGLEGYTYLE